LVFATAAVVEALEERRLLSSPWGVQDTAIGLDKARNNYPSITGSGESIAVIDTGVDYNASELGGGFGPGYKVEAGYNFINNTANPYPLNSTDDHGTGPADVIGDNSFTYQGYQYQGVAPGANIIALAEQNTYEVQDALNWVIANRTKYNIVAVNITDFGGGPWNTYVSQLNTLIADGVYITFPAGNSSSQATPPIASGVVSVGSVNPSSLALSSFSNYGKYIPILAPGEEMTLPYLNSNNGEQCIVTGIYGTSYAAPQVAATAALLKEINPNLSVAQMTQMIEESGTPITSGGVNYAVLNVNGALALAYASLKPSKRAPARGPAPAPVAITTNPTSQSVSAGQTVTLTAAASGNPTSVGWQVSTNGGKTFTNIPGANNATYSFTASAGENGDEYKAFFSNSQGSAVSAAATLTVGGPGQAGRSSVSGIVYLDRHDHGVKTHRDPGLADITVTLRQLTWRAKAEYATQTVQTDANGHYVFTNLVAGAMYQICAARPGRCIATQNPTGIYTLQLSTGQNVTGVNFGEMPGNARRRAA
jgi:hypothetical protein